MSKSQGQIAALLICGMIPMGMILMLNWHFNRLDAALDDATHKTAAEIIRLSDDIRQSNPPETER